MVSTGKIEEQRENVRQKETRGPFIVAQSRRREEVAARKRPAENVERIIGRLKKARAESRRL